MEETRTGKVVGSSLIIAQHGTRDAPHIFFDVYEKEHYSASVDRHFRHRVLSIGYNFDGKDAVAEVPVDARAVVRSEEHTSELQSPDHLVCRLLLEKKKKNKIIKYNVT